MRFSDLDPRLVTAWPSINATEPIDISIEAKVVRIVEVHEKEVHIEATPDDATVLEEGAGSQGSATVILGVALGIVALVMVLLILHVMGKINLTKGNKKCCSCKKCRCRKKKLTPYQIQKLQEKDALKAEIEKSAAEQSLKEKTKFKIEN